MWLEPVSATCIDSLKSVPDVDSKSLHLWVAANSFSDNLQVEDPVSGVEGVFLPFHLLCLRDMGLMLCEYWDLTALAADCAADGVY